MGSMIDRYLLRYFLAVVDAGTFSRAATQVNVTQPTLSVGIAKLERLVGAPLFHRTSQRVHLTEAGSRLVAHAQRIENDFNLIAGTIANAADAPVIRVGVLSSIPTAMLERIVAEHRRREVQAQIELVEGTERDLVSRMARGRIDLALTVLRTAGEWRQELLYREGYALALPRWHRFAGVASVKPEDLAEETMIVRRNCEALSETSRHFTSHGVRPRFSFRTTNDDRALAMVRAGLGITVMPDAYQDRGVARPRLEGFTVIREIGILHGDRAEGCAPIVDIIRTAIARERPEKA